ncbi:MAG: hypothetical protein RIQ93_1562, partial [Verrucomicrobiota bacterium]
SEKDEWDKLTAAEEDELPTFFEAIKPHMRRNQRGPGMSVGADYLAKKWDQLEEDVKGALVECGFELPADEDSPPVYVEYDGDLFWLNINRRGELWINTKEKPRPVFRAVKAARVTVEEEPRADAPRPESRSPQPDERRSKPEDGAQTLPAPAPQPGEPALAAEAQPRNQQRQGQRGALPEGPALLARIRPHMRRNRRGPGGSGSTSFLSRALKCNESDLKTAFQAMGLSVPANPAEKPVFVEIGDELWWLNADSRGGLWINGREKLAGETAQSAATKEAESNAAAAAAETAAAPTDAPATAPQQNAPAAETAPPAPAVAPTSAASAASAPQRDDAAIFAAVRLLLKATRTGGFAAKTDRVAESLGRSEDDLVATLVAAGLKTPEKPREKPVFVEQAGEIFWLNRNAKGELWVNAKASKFADKKESSEGEGAPASAATGERAPKSDRRGGRSRRKA